MVKLSELINDKQLNKIAEGIVGKLNKMGIPVTSAETAFHTKQNGEEWLEIETNEFNTTPSIYKSIVVYGTSYIKRDELSTDFPLVEIAFKLNYRFLYYSNSNNGLEIGEINFDIRPKQDVYCNGLTI